MPVINSKDEKGCYARWGTEGKKYYYKCSSSQGRRLAQEKAAKQGRAIHASKRLS